MPRDHQKGVPNGHNRPQTAPYVRNKRPSSSSQTKVKREVVEQRQSDDKPVASSSKPSTYEVLAERMESRKTRKQRKRSRSRDAQTQPQSSQSTKPDMPPDDVYQKYLKLKKNGSKARAILSPSGKNNGAESSTSSPVLIAPPKVKFKPEGSTVEKPNDNLKAQMLQVRMDRMREEAEKERDTLTARVAELEKEVETLKGADTERNKIVQEHTKLHDALTEAVNCHICFEPFNDPHILTCGHVACKGCFVNYFRSPAAYFHPMETVLANRDLSHFRKMCHICREPVIHRPVRMYGLRNILEALGIDGHMPSPSQSRAEHLATRDNAEDPWHLSFPEEKDDYRQHDEADGVYRCRDCWGEIDGDQCAHCGNLFSEHESHLGDEDDMGLIGSDEEDMVVGSDDSDLEDLEDVAGIARILGRRHRLAEQPIELLDSDNDAEMAGDEVQDPVGQRRRFRAIMRGDDRRPADGRGVRIRDIVRARLEADSDDDAFSEGERDYIRHRRDRREHLLDLVADEDRLGDGGDYPEDPESEDETYSEEEEYQASFIDDGELDELNGGNTTGSSEHSGSDVEVLEVDDGVDEPIYIPPAPRGRNRQRVYEDPDEDSEDS